MTPTNGSGNISGGEFPIDALPEEEDDSSAPDAAVAGGTLALFWALQRRRV